MALDDRRTATGGGDTGHPGFEMLAAYADRKLTVTEAANVERHAAGCVACREALADASAFLEAEGKFDDMQPGTVEFHTPRARQSSQLVAVGAVLAAAAVLVVGLRVVSPERLPNWLGGSRQDAMVKALVLAAAEAPTRFTEGRLTGGFAYAVAPSVTRGDADEEISPKVKMAATQLEQEVAGAVGAPAARSLGLAFLAANQLRRAVAAMEQAAALAPDDAGIQSDLSAAYLERARRVDRDYTAALAAAERALAMPDPPIEAWFNRAVALERIGARERAAQAWQDYLSRDNSSQWAAEARQRAEALVPSTPLP